MALLFRFAADDGSRAVLGRLRKACFGRSSTTFAQQLLSLCEASMVALTAPSEPSIHDGCPLVCRVTMCPPHLLDVTFACGTASDGMQKRPTPIPCPRHLQHMRACARFLTRRPKPLNRCH